MVVLAGDMSGMLEVVMLAMIVVLGMAIGMPCHCLFSRTDWKLIYSAAAMMFSDISQTCLLCSFSHSSGPCSSFNCLSHSKKVVDDDDDLCASGYLWSVFVGQEGRYICRGGHVWTAD